MSYFTIDPQFSDGDVGELRLYGPDDVHVDGTVFVTGRDPICDLRVTRDGEHVIGTDGGYIKVWNIEEKLRGASSLVSALYHSGIKIGAVAVTPDSQRIISADLHSTVRVWLLGGTLESTFLELHKAVGRRKLGREVTGLEALPDSKHAMSSSVDRTIKIFGLHDGAVLRTITCPARVRHIALLHDGRRFLFVQEGPGSESERACIAEHGMSNN